MRLGGTECVKVDVRIIAATNTDLRALVDTGEFREDLFYRLNVIALEVPPLRDRREDIRPLVDFFIQKYCQENDKPIYRFSAEALKVLMDYSWPGNVRELENAVERAVVLAYSDVIGQDLLPQSVTRPPPRFATPASLGLDENASLFEIVDAFEKRTILDRMEQSRWSQTEAAASFHVALSTLNQKIKRHGIKSRKKKEKSPA